jgi:hypothetical protein
MARLDYEQTRDRLQALADSGSETMPLVSGERSVVWQEEGGWAKLSFPLTFPPIPSDVTTPAQYLDWLPEGMPAHFVVLMRAGNASLGCYLEGDLVAHKVIRKYMVRKSQGKSQLTYLNSKGKSRAGSRVRLRESMEFFEEINDKLGQWDEEFGSPDLIFYSCPVRLLSYWFDSRIAAPFEQDDPRLVHIPHHVHQPDHEELLRIHGLISFGRLESFPSMPL